MTIPEQKERFGFLSAAFALTPEEQARDHAYRAAMKLKQIEAMTDFNDDDGAEDKGHDVAENEDTDGAEVEGTDEPEDKTTATTTTATNESGEAREGLTSMERTAATPKSVMAKMTTLPKSLPTKTKKQQLANDSWANEIGLDPIANCLLAHFKDKFPEDMSTRELEQVISILPHQSRMRQRAAAELKMRGRRRGMISFLGLCLKMVSCCILVLLRR